MLLAVEEDNSSNSSRMLQRQHFTVRPNLRWPFRSVHRSRFWPSDSSLGGGRHGVPFTGGAGQGGEGLYLGLQVAVEELEIEHQAACLTQLTFCALPGRVLLPPWGGPFSTFLQ